MPINFPIPLQPLSVEEFDEIDFRVVGHAFASQNCLGRLCEESVYQLDLQAGLRALQWINLNHGIVEFVTLRR
jgi:hypothetical protein